MKSAWKKPGFPFVYWENQGFTERRGRDLNPGGKNIRQGKPVVKKLSAAYTLMVRLPVKVARPCLGTLAVPTKESGSVN